jgi:phosphoglycolate phosphatase
MSVRAMPVDEVSPKGAVYPENRPSLEKYRAFLFDIDGTLLRTGGAGVRAFRRTAALWGHPGAMDRVSFHGRTDTSLARQFLAGAGLPDTAVECERFLAVYAFLLEEELSRGGGELCPAVPALLHVLESLPEPPLMGLLTGNVRMGAVLKLAAHGLEHRFVLGAFGDDHESRNQLAVVARQRVSKCLGTPVPGSAIVVIGDTPADIECARAIQAPCLAVATGAFSVHDLRLHQPDWVVSSFEELLHSPDATREGASNASGIP